MALNEYRRKRHFDKTPEPGPEVKTTPTGRLYVIQKHAASRLHYDFRLELDGVLKSWAVPKGPSLDPAEKRLAVHVEDHPVAYGAFEGVIPEHEYGGGTVMLWDRGEWEPSGDAADMYKRGRLKFRLHGKKLRGGWSLVRMARKEADRENWLLIKEKDDHARPAKEGDILEEKPLSVSTRRSMERIAAESDRVWTSAGEEEGRGASATKTGARTDEGRGKSKSRGLQPARRGRKQSTSERAIRRSAASTTQEPRGEGERTAIPKAPRASARAAPMRWRTPRNGQDKVIRRQGDKGLRPDAPQSEIRNPESEIAHLPDARKARQPVFLAPQLATLVKDVPAGGNWLHEVKFDGYRMLAVIAGGQVRLMTRREQDWTARFPVIARALLDLPIEQAILDGELVVLRPDGVSDFQAMQNALKGGPKTNLVYYLFDLPHCGGYDLTRTPLIERKRLLRELLQDQPPEGRIRFSDHIAGQGLTVLQHACRLGLEGIICKREDSPYESARTPAWLKVKCLRRQEFVIGGFTDPGGARKGFGALLLGYNDDLGRLRYCGKVGTGFDAQTLHQIYNQVAALETHRPPFFDPPRGAEARGAHWIKPKLVAEIAFTEWTEDSHLRHPSFQGLREDKVPSEVTREEPQSMPRANGRGRTRTDARSPAPRRARPTADEHLEIAGVAISNPQRVLYADQGLTKGELAEYYQGIAEWILPHVARRPLTLVRCPEGQGGQCFYQKHVGEHLPRALRGIPIMEKNEPEQYFVVDDLAGLIALVQMGVLEIHVWGSREKDVEKPDRLIIDLDPGPEVEWADVVEAAVVVRDHLQELELESFVKTSGGKGLHVVAPIVPRADWDQVKAFAKQVATDIARRDPSQYVAVMTKAKRTGRIFIDYLRNGRGATAVAAYSTRARPGAPVSAPLRWDELPRLTGANQFTLRNLPRRIKMLKKDPWEGFLELRQRIPT